MPSHPSLYTALLIVIDSSPAPYTNVIHPPPHLPPLPFFILFNYVLSSHIHPPNTHP